MCVNHIIDENCPLADAWSMVLSNVSRSNELTELVFDEMETKMVQLIDAFTRIDYNKKKCHLNYLGKCNEKIQLLNAASNDRWVN